MADPVRRRELFRKLVQPDPAPEPRVFVRLTNDRCIAFAGPECGACAGLCPEGVDALCLAAGRPVVDARACTGCGECVLACPTSPRALDLVRWVD